MKGILHLKLSLTVSLAFPGIVSRFSLLYFNLFNIRLTLIILPFSKTTVHYKCTSNMLSKYHQNIIRILLEFHYKIIRILFKNIKSVSILMGALLEKLRISSVEWFSTLVPVYNIENYRSSSTHCFLCNLSYANFILF